MRRIIYNMMICCAAAWLLAACSKDDDLPGGQTGGNGNSIILDISSGALPVSRATVPAEGAEVAVSHIDVLIFNDTDEKTKVWSDRVNASANETGRITLPVKRSSFTENERYWVYLIANSTHPEKDFENLANLNALKAMTQEDVMTCRAIGEAGMTLISDLYARLRRPVNVLTHCNAGWLATVDYGTALSPIYMAFEQGTPLHVWVDETRPRNQGLLTAWELGQHGVPYTLVADNAGGQLMQQCDVDLVIVGADRITRRGDVANKIGTYLKALAAVDNEVPFYVAAPSSTIDWTLNDGKREIPIENRAASELLVVNGVGSDGETRTVQIAAPEVAVANPAFDVTHNRFVTGIITERGIVKPTDLTAVFADLLPKA